MSSSKTLGKALTAPERRALSILNTVQSGKHETVDLHTVTNKTKTLAFLRLHLAEYPELILLGNRFLQIKKHRLRSIVKRIIQGHRRRCNLWFRLTKEVVLQMLEEQFDLEYDCGYRQACGSRMSACKAECALLEHFPSLGSMSEDPPLMTRLQE